MSDEKSGAVPVEQVNPPVTAPPQYEHVPPQATPSVEAEDDSEEIEAEEGSHQASGHCGLLVEDDSEHAKLSIVEPFTCGTCGRVMERTSFVQTIKDGKQCAIAISQGKADPAKPAVPVGSEPVKSDG